MVQTPAPTSWESILGAVASVANFGLLIFAGVQVWRERRRDTQRAAAATAHASNLAYLLRREIRALIGVPPTRDSFETRLRALQSENRYHRAVDEIAADAKALSTTAIEASPTVAAAAPLIYVHVHEGLRRVDE